MKKNVDVKDVFNFDPIVVDIKTKQQQIGLHFRAHWNLWGRIKMASHWYKMYKRYELIPDGKSLITFKYGNRVLFSFGTAPLCGFIRGWAYYPHYVKYEKPKDRFYQPTISMGVGQIVNANVRAIEKDVIDRMVKAAEAPFEVSEDEMPEHIKNLSKK